MAVKKEAAPEVDKHGFVSMSNGKTTVKVVASAVRVWTERGWSVEDLTETEAAAVEKQEG